MGVGGMRDYDWMLCYDYYFVFIIMNGICCEMFCIDYYEEMK